jgi:hypothetical protein
MSNIKMQKTGAEVCVFAKVGPASDLARRPPWHGVSRLTMQSHLIAIPVAARKDDAPAAGQAAITNIAAVTPFSGAGGLIQTTSG